MADALVLVTVSDGIATVTLNRPDKANALSVDLCDALLASLRALVARPASEARVIILTGAGRAFCAGGDLAGLAQGGGPALVAAGKEVALLLRGAPQPVIAAVNGAAAGGGANLALACDYRLAADGAAIGQVFARLGLAPDWGGSYFLPRLVGPAKALELAWSARMVPAAEAHALGLFDRVVPAERLLAEARALAAVWAGHPPLTLHKVKDLLYRSERATLREMLDAEITLQHELFATPEARERIGASLATRSR